MICATCGCACPEGTKFCMLCGTALSPSEEPMMQPTSTEASPVSQDVSGPDPVLEEMSYEERSVAEPAASSQESLPVWQTSPYQPPAASPLPAKKGTHWIPIAIMSVLCVIGFVLFLALPFGSGDAPAVSNSETPWFYNDNGTLYFYEEHYTGPEELTVPELVDGQPVTELGAYCFAGCDFTTVILPDTLETIGANAFDGCTLMRGIFLPEGVVHIGSEAFYCCSELEAICIPSTVKTIEAGAFDGCFGLNFILYNGIHSHWLDLYGDMIGQKTQVYCIDGTFVHRHVFP